MSTVPVTLATTVSLSDVERECVQQAADEVQRELNVRERCFPRWIQDGRLSKSDGADRLRRQQYAAAVLSWVLEAHSLGGLAPRPLLVSITEAEKIPLDKPATPF